MDRKNEKQKQKTAVGGNVVHPDSRKAHQMIREIKRTEKKKQNKRLKSKLKLPIGEFF